MMHDDPTAVATLQPGIERHGTEAGYVAFKRARGGRPVVLGPPVAPTEVRKQLLLSFLGQERRAVFSYLRRQDALALQEVAPRRFFFTGMGIERVIELRRNGPGWESKVRGALRGAARAKLRLNERMPGTLEKQERARLVEITELYLARTRLGREMGFFNRPMMFEADPGRLFLLDKEDREHQGTFGYAQLDPYMTAGGPGWLLCNIRFLRTRLWGVYLSVVALLIEKLRAEGAVELSLGFLPLLRPHADPSLRSSFLAKGQVQIAAALRHFFYEMRTLDRLKESFIGRDDQRYLATPGPWIVGPGLALLDVMGLGLSGGRVNSMEKPIEIRRSVV